MQPARRTRIAIWASGAAIPAMVCFTACGSVENEDPFVHESREGSTTMPDGSYLPPSVSAEDARDALKDGVLLELLPSSKWRSYPAETLKSVARELCVNVGNSVSAREAISEAVSTIPMSDQEVIDFKTAAATTYCPEFMQILTK